jgi:hypothetical protein
MRRGLLSMLAGAAFLLVASAGPLAAQTSSSGAENAPDTVRLDGSRLGVVTFSHAAHAELSGCDACHHESRPEHPLQTRYQPCGDCHTDPVEAPMVTPLGEIFHTARAKSGICVDCHVEQEAAGVQVPTQCRDCHVRESAGRDDSDAIPALAWWYLRR